MQLCANISIMTKQQERLTKSYKKFRKANISTQRILGFLHSFMPEIIFRTTKLEGEKVSRHNVSSIFK